MHGTAFVYGTLTVPEVVHAVLRRVPLMSDASLKGYSRCCIRGQVFPAIIPSSKAEAVVHGKVLHELSSQEMKLLDIYEAEEYYRETVTATLKGGESVHAEAYIWGEEHSDLLELDTEWDVEEFMEKYFEAYLYRSRKYMDQVHAELSEEDAEGEE